MAIQNALRLPAHRFRQGGRDVYACVLDLPALNSQLPDRVDDRVVRDANRQLTPSHARKIQSYLADRSDWVLGALMLGVSEEALDFSPYTEGAGTPMQIGELLIRSDSTATMKMFDGQHRRRAIKDVLRELELDMRRASTLSALQGCSLPLMLYVEDDMEALRQMFADASKTKTIERNTVARFDLRDAFNLAALWLEENSNLFVGRVEMERASVPRSSECIVAINQLSATLKSIEVGYSGRVSKEANDRYMLNLDDLYEECWTWADDFMPAAREEYERLMAGDIDNSEIPEGRNTSLSYNATVIRLFAGCYYEWNPGQRGLEAVGRVHPELFTGTWGWAGRFAVGGCRSGRSRGITPFARLDSVKSAIGYIVGQAAKASD